MTNFMMAFLKALHRGYPFHFLMPLPLCFRVVRPSVLAVRAWFHHKIFKFLVKLFSGPHYLWTFWLVDALCWARCPVLCSVPCVQLGALCCRAWCPVSSSVPPSQHADVGPMLASCWHGWLWSVAVGCTRLGNQQHANGWLYNDGPMLGQCQYKDI